MRLALIGRTRMLLETAKLLIERKHKIELIWTSPTEKYYHTDEAEFEAMAKSVGAVFVNSAKINTPEAESLLGKLDLDIALSVNFTNIIEEKILEKLRFGSLNLHAGDLPRYRGNAVINWAIINNEEKVVLCVHKMTKELDAGPIILKKSFPLTDETYVGEVYSWMEKTSAEMLVNAAEGLVSGTILPKEQSSVSSMVLRCFPRKPEDSLIDWKQNAVDIHRLVRASSHPFNGAYSFLEKDKKVIVWRASVIMPEWKFCAIPGQVCHVENGNPVIACGDGMLSLSDVEIPDSGLTSDKVKKIISKSLRNRFYSQ